MIYLVMEKKIIVYEFMDRNHCLKGVKYMVETINNFKNIIETIKNDIKSIRLRVMENASKTE